MMEENRIELKCEDDRPNGTIPCEGEVRLMFCPYESDVHERDVLALLCERHEYERIRDI